jgi:hypothetical protein
MKHIKFTALLVFVNAFFYSFSQDIQPQEKLVLSDSLVFMGIDMSTAKFIHPNKTDESGYIRDKHGAAWCQVDDQIAKRQDLKYDFQKKVVFSMTSIFDESYKQVDSNWVVAEYNGLSDQDVKDHISKYALIPNQRLGMVLLVDKMDRTRSSLSVCAAYIDLQTDQVIKIIRGEGSIGGYGYTAFFTTGLENAYHDVISKDDKYLKALKKYFGVGK